MPTTWQEARLDLTLKRPSCRPTGKHPSPRSASVWRSASRSSSLSSRSRPTLCSHWLLTADTAPPRWVVTRGRRWLVPRRPCRPTVTRKASTSSAGTSFTQEQELVSLETTKRIAKPVTLESGLEREGTVMTPTRVEIMATKGSKPWDTSWFNKVELTRTLLYNRATDTIKTWFNHLLTVIEVNFWLHQSLLWVYLTNATKKWTDRLKDCLTVLTALTVHNDWLTDSLAD